MFEIAEYLSLNDTVSTFSTAVLPVLWRYNRKLPVIRPSKEFIETINQSHNHDKILSLRLDESQFRRIIRLATSNTFANVRSLTIFNFEDKKQIWEMRTHFPVLNHLSLHYDGELDFHQICKIFELIPPSVKRFEISCHSIKCSHYRHEHLFTRVDPNETVESFALRVNSIPSLFVNRCIQSHKKCILRTITDWMKIMLNIQYVRIITNQGHIEPLLDDTEWGNGFVTRCSKLNKIVLKAATTKLCKEELDKRIKATADALHSKRQSIEFKVTLKKKVFQ